MIQLLRNLVLIKKLTKSEELKERLERAGLEAPEVADNKNAVEKGEIIQVGQELKNWQKLVGQKVIFNSWAGDEIDLDGQKFLIVHVDDILAIYS